MKKTSMFLRGSFLLIMVHSLLFAQESRLNIAVLDLDPTGIAKAEAQFLSDRLRTELFETGHFQVVERDKMNAILGEQGFQQTGCTSVECAVEVGQLLNVNTMAAGKIGKIDEIYSISVRLINVQTGAIVQTATRDFEGRLSEVLTDVIPELAEDLASASKSTEKVVPIVEKPSEIKTEKKSDDWNPFTVKAKIGFSSLKYTADMNAQIQNLDPSLQSKFNDFGGHLFIGFEGSYLLSNHWELKLGIGLENMFSPWEFSIDNYTSIDGLDYSLIDIKRENRFANTYIGINYLIWSKMNQYNFYLGADIGATVYTSTITQFYSDAATLIEASYDDTYEYTHFTWKLVLGGNYFISSSFSLGIELIAKIESSFNTGDQKVPPELPEEFEPIIFPGDLTIDPSGLILDINIGYHF